MLEFKTMSDLIIPLPLEGEELKSRLKQKILHYPIVENLLYKNASLMLSSQPSVGKSVLAIQAALQISNGIPLFSVLNVPQAVKVWYIQMERSETESLERIQLMIDETNWHTDNLVIDVELQALNFLNPKHFDIVIARGKKIQPAVIIIDPLYGIAPGLSKDEVGSNIAKIFTILKKELNCAIWINHHTVKSTYEIIDNQKIPKDDPFYGAQWLKAHVTASYYIEQDKDGTLWHCKKDSHSLLFKQIKLSFDYDTYLSTMQADNLEVWERYKLFIGSKFRSQNKIYTFSEAQLFLKCASTTLREFHRDENFKTFVKPHRSLGKETKYEVICSI